jgi:hypothetical protein
MDKFSLIISYLNDKAYSCPFVMKTMQYLILLTIAASCATASKSLTEAKARERMNSLDQDAQNNINTLIEMLEELSLVTDPGRKRYIPYEFRIPLDSAKRNEVHRIDPSIHFTSRTDSYQCIGDNATKEKVFQIVALPYTSRIRFCPYE